MSKVFQSIEDLIQASQGDPGEREGTFTKFNEKQEEIKHKDIERLTHDQASVFGLPYIDLTGFPISPEAISIISMEEAERLLTVCFYYDGVNIRFAAITPTEEVINLVEQLAEEYHAKPLLYVISQYSLDFALFYYRSLPKLKKPMRGVEIKEADLKKFDAKLSSFDKIQETINNVSVSDVVTMLIAAAIQTDSSDIHIEGEEVGIKVRFRIDGVLHDAAVIDKKKWSKIISRMKLLAGVKINVMGKPQDGRYSIFMANDRIDVRSSFLPTSFGESVVMRLLRSTSIGVQFDELGLRSELYDILLREISKPNGLILTTGPTGSGKTTTLYAILNKINKPQTKIVTLEDPIEYQLKGINQSQVDTSKNYTFASGLRSILRQDPDVVMVGEIRDLETAEISIQAGLTGHLVLSTLHTNDASGVIPRLTDMGVKPYFLAPSINCVIGQRLVRKLCNSCKKEHILTKDEEAQVKKILAVVSPKSGVKIPTDLPKIFKAGDGCDECNYLGYKGRVGIYEVFTMSNSIKELASKESPAFKILEQAIEDGMITMLQDGVFKSLEGVTSLEEVYRVIGKFDYIDALYEIVAMKIIGRGIKITSEEIIKGGEYSKDMDSLSKILPQVPVEKFLNILLSIAISSDAGDVHIEPAEDGVKIRLRIDGILYSLAMISDDLYLPILSRIKMLAGFPTNIKKASWDGRFSILAGTDKIDCRLSIISGGYGETVVIRLLTVKISDMSMETLGMRPYTLEKIQGILKQTKGVILTSGPTGSGKTTTLYSMLNKLNKPDVKIITIEDPIEYHLDGAMQTQIDTESGYTFPVALRSLLRQNPNIIMVGEVRDDETAEIAIESAMTGHLVLSTIHANTASGVIPRLVGLRVQKHLVASSITCTIGQRLARKLCPHCKEKAEYNEAVLIRVREILAGLPKTINFKIPDEMKFYKGKGCPQCNNLGYKGRIGIYEVIDMTPQMQTLVQKAEYSEDDIEKLAISEGAVLMMQDGVLKALDGETSLDEIFRVAE